MNRQISKSLFLLSGLTALASACVGDDNTKVTPEVPYADEWQVVVEDVPFPAAVGCTGPDPDVCGTAGDEATCQMGAEQGYECVWIASAVTDLTIGGRLTDDNFANRGDIEVYYTNETSVIRVEMRRFTFASDEAEAQANYDFMKFWAFATPTPTPSPDPLTDCSAVWKDDCMIRVWYDGLNQPLRDGADFRVYLPIGWEGNLTIATEDAEQEETDYPRRSNVLVKGSAGSVRVTSVGSGEVEIEMASGLEEAPLDCTADQHDACDEIAWDANGLCLGGGACDDLSETNCGMTDPCEWAVCGCDDFGTIQVDTIPGRAANITVELPETLWAKLRLANDQAGLMPSSEPFCPAEVACGDFGDCFVDPVVSKCQGDDCWVADGEVNWPGAEPAGFGYNVRLTSDGCANISTARSPEDFEMPVAVNKGNLLACSDCLDIDVP